MTNVLTHVRYSHFNFFVYQYVQGFLFLTEKEREITQE